MSPEQQRSIVGLVAQVDVDNVLKAGKLFRTQADEMKAQLVAAKTNLRVGRCGDDPVSREAQKSFQGKIDQILAVHWAHWEELNAACDALRAAARGYGHAEDIITATFGAEGGSR